MTCETAIRLLEPFLDDELEASQRADVAAHLATCRTCAVVYAPLLELRQGIRSHAPYYRAPDGLRDRVRASLRQAERRPANSWRAIAIAAAILLAISAAFNIALMKSRTAGGDVIAGNILASHIRSLMGTHLLDVPSTDQHTVKPWFNGKLDFSPDVRDFAAQGYPLIGGRMDYIDGHPAAALVFQRRKHIVNVFTWPSNAPDGDAGLSRNGYQIVHWSRGGMTYWAVSDLNSGELSQFAALYRH